MHFIWNRKIPCKSNRKICDWRATWRYRTYWEKNYCRYLRRKRGSWWRCFFWKDPSKVDRSAAYATRHIAKNLVAAGVAERILVQVSYAIGVAEPMGIFVDTYGTAKVNMTDGEIAEIVKNMPCFNLKPASIISRLKLKNPIYSETAAYGHMGRESENKTVTFHINGKKKTLK